MTEGLEEMAISSDRDVKSSNDQHWGIAPRLMRDLFTHLQSGASSSSSVSSSADSSSESSSSSTMLGYSVKVSCLEIYNENVYDLLSKEGILSAKNIVIRENEAGDTVTTGLTEISVSSADETAAALIRGLSSRQTGSTAMNARSSRSHAIFSIIIEQTFQHSSLEPNQQNLAKRTSRIHLVDLAGSERVKKTNASGDRFTEGTSINKSLLSLGNVINALAGIEDRAAAAASSADSTTSSQQIHIPYRDSKLTRLLKSSLGGNACTLMVACASPADSNIEETISTLRYASRARSIKNVAKVNTDPVVAQMAALRKQVRDLEEALLSARAAAANGSSGGGVLSSHDAQIADSQIAERLNFAEDVNQRLVLELKATRMQLKTQSTTSERNFDRACAAEETRDNLRVHLQDLTRAVRTTISRATLPSTEYVVIDSDNSQLPPFLRELPWLTDLAEKALKEAGEVDVATAMDLDEDNADLTSEDVKWDVDLSGLELRPQGGETENKSTISRDSDTIMASAEMTASSRVKAVRSELEAVSNALFAKQRLLNSYENGASSSSSSSSSLSTLPIDSLTSSSNSSSFPVSHADDATELQRIAAALAAAIAERDQLQARVQEAASVTAISLSNPHSAASSEHVLVSLRAALNAKQAQLSQLQARQLELQKMLATRGKAESERAKLWIEVASLRQHKASLSRVLREEQARQRAELVKMRATAGIAIRERNKAQLEQLKLQSALEKQQAVMRKQMEEKANLKRKLQDQSGQLAQLRVAARANAGVGSSSSATAMIVTDTHVDGGGAAELSAPLTSFSGSVSRSTESDLFFAIAAAQVSVQAITGKGQLFSTHMHGSVKAAVKRGIIPSSSLPTATSDDLANPARGDDFETNEDEGGRSAYDAGDSSSSSSSLVSSKADGLVSLADCFANSQATKVPSSLRSLLEGDIAARVTLRRASTLAAHLHAERKILAGRRSELKKEMLDPTLQPHSNMNAMLSSLDGQIAVVSNQLASVVDVIVTLKTQLEPESVSQTTTGGQATATRSSVRHRAKQWGAEVADIHIARKAIQWLSTSVTALAEKLLDAYSGDVPDIRNRLADPTLLSGTGLSTDTSILTDVASTFTLVDFSKKSSGESVLEQQHSVPHVIQAHKKATVDRIVKKDVVDSDEELSAKHIDEEEEDENEAPFADDDQDSDYEAEISSKKRKASKKNTALKGDAKNSLGAGIATDVQGKGGRKRKATIESSRLLDEGEAVQSIKSNIAPRSKRVRASIKEETVLSETAIVVPTHISRSIDVGQVQEPHQLSNDHQLMTDSHDDFVPAHEVFTTSTSIESHGGLKPSSHSSIPSLRAPTPSVNVLKPVPPPHRISIMAGTGRTSLGGTSGISNTGLGGRVSLGRTTVFSTTATMAAASVSAAPAQAKRAALGSLSQNTHTGGGLKGKVNSISAQPPLPPNQANSS